MVFEEEIKAKRILILLTFQSHEQQEDCFFMLNYLNNKDLVLVLDYKREYGAYLVPFETLY